MRIQLLSGPRNISTALMYSFAQRRDMSVVDEPFYACYLNTSHADHPGKEDILKSQSVNPTDVIKNVISGSYPTQHVFLKNMTKHIENIDLSYCENTINIFLIRDPEQLITSFSKVVQHPDESEIGLHASWKLFQHLNRAENPAFVLNSEYILKNPKGVLTQLCNCIGIDFDETMLSWPAVARTEDGIWAAYWYKNVHQSTGFGSPVKTKTSLPKHLQPLLEQVTPYFNKLNQFSINV